MVQIVPLRPEWEERFYALAAEYLPDGDPRRMRRFAAKYPRAFLTLLEDDQLIGVAYGWLRSEIVPDDPAFCLDGICVRWDHMRQGLGSRLLSAVEAAAASYGAPVISAGVAGDHAEDFYLRNGYAPSEYKVWQADGSIAVEKTFADEADYRSYQRKDPSGFVVMVKAL